MWKDPDYPVVPRDLDGIYDGVSSGVEIPRRAVARKDVGLASVPDRASAVRYVGRGCAVCGRVETVCQSGCCPVQRLITSGTHPV